MGRPPTITRAQILDASRRRFANVGFSATTLADIAGDLSVTPAAVLRHFASKQELFDVAMRHTLELPKCIADLEHVDASRDPRVVLRGVAEGWVPFAETTIAQNIAVAFHERATIVLPFEVDDDNSPPRKGLRIVADYFRRAHEAGVVNISDPRAAALLFMGTLVGYVFIHNVVRGMPQRYPLPAFIDALLDLWTEGGLARSSGGSSARQKLASETADPDRDHRRGRNRVADLHARKEKAARARPVRNARSENGQRGVARRRTRRSRTDR